MKMVGMMLYATIQIQVLHQHYFFIFFILHLKRYVDLYIHFNSSIYYFYFITYTYIILLLKMRKGANGAPNSFRTFIEKIKIERVNKQRLKNVELDPTLTHFIWNGLDTIQYQVIQGDCEDIAKLIPKRDYFLVIADIPHGFSISNIDYDSDPYTYQALSKVFVGFVEVT